MMDELPGGAEQRFSDFGMFCSYAACSAGLILARVTGVRQILSQ